MGDPPRPNPDPGRTPHTVGDNARGQLGLGSTTDKSSPTVVPTVTGVTTWALVDAGWSHTCAIVATGTTPGKLYCWGKWAVWSICTSWRDLGVARAVLLFGRVSG